ncbi:SDR family oxidoreductase [Ectopseudomonas mendocina]|uniref:SDR family oxidoreductase n=1 Tax=Ectopseudomonas mendocina TaxID=300 RepID=A0ABZ2RPG9_ECTME
MASPPQILIVGASRGIGLGLSKAFVDAGWTVHAVARSLHNSPQLTALARQYESQIQLIECDLLQADAAHVIKQALDEQKLQAALLNAGVYGPAHQDPKQADASEIGALFQVNAVAPVALAQQLTSSITEGGVIGFTSSQMGSLQLNHAQAMPLYGASKAALNSLLLSWSSTFEQLPWSLLAIHPGWVRTDMGGPNATLSVEQSAQGIVQVITSHIGRNHCAFVDYQDTELPW